MSRTVKYYLPKCAVNLFNSNEQKICQGVLYLTVEPKPYQRKNYLLQSIAIGLLFISVFSITTTTLPIASAIYEIVKPQRQPQFNLNLKKDPNTYSENFVLTNGEEFKSNEFFLSIPSINLTSNIIPNVDASNEAIYKEELKKGIAHANGSYYPGEGGSVFLFAHSTDTLFNVEQWNAKFYALKDTEVSDEIKINFRGKTYYYKITDKKIIGPQDLETIRQANADLILSTCWPPGTNWQRLIVFAQEEKVLEN